MAVEWKLLSDVCSVHTGMQLNRDDMLEEGLYPVMNGGRTSSGYTNTANEKANSITISQGGESAGFVNWIDTDFWAGAHCYVFSDFKISKRYLYHFLKNREEQIRAKRQGAGIPGLNRNALMRLSIPVPHKDIQDSLVSKLDTFTSLISKLDEEIELRKKQISFYLESILFGEDDTNSLSDYAFMGKGRVSADKLSSDNYVSVENLLKNKAGRRDAETVPSEGNWVAYSAGDVLIGNIRPYLRKIWFADRNGGTNGDVVVVRSKDKNQLLPRFLYYVLSSEKFFNYYSSSVKDGKMPRGDKGKLLDFAFPYKERDIQYSLIEKFDTMNTLISKLEEERDLRQKQYEYYREKLLTFE